MQAWCLPACRHSTADARGCCGARKTVRLLLLAHVGDERLLLPRRLELLSVAASAFGMVAKPMALGETVSRLVIYYQGTQHPSTKQGEARRRQL